MKSFSYAAVSILLFINSCFPMRENSGIIDILDPRAKALLDVSSSFDTMATGLNWSEGPLYLPEQQVWLFSDVPDNKVYQVNKEKKLSVYLKPSGYTDTLYRGGETGSNGLLLDPDNQLVLMQHGDRRVARMMAPLDQPVPVFSSLTEMYQGMRFNSPNDGVFDKNGNLYFTDPPYGLEGNMEDPKKEIPFQGVYCLLKSGELLLVDSLSRPNGVVLTPDESTLIVAVSDPNQAIWYQYPLAAPGKVGKRSVYINFTSLVGPPEYKGLPDGMKMHSDGYLFASGPGGIWVFYEQKAIARIITGQATSNCAFSDDWKTLLITADDYIFSLPIK